MTRTKYTPAVETLTSTFNRIFGNRQQNAEQDRAAGAGGANTSPSSSGTQPQQNLHQSTSQNPHNPMANNGQQQQRSPIWRTPAGAQNGEQAQNMQGQGQGQQQANPQGPAFLSLPFACPIINCPRRFEKKIGLTHHLTKGHRDLQQPRSRSVPQRVPVVGHLRTSPRRPQQQQQHKHRCPVCLKELSTKAYLRKHLDKQHQRPQAPLPTPRAHAPSPAPPGPPPVSPRAPPTTAPCPHGPLATSTPNLAAGNSSGMRHVRFSDDAPLPSTSAAAASAESDDDIMEIDEKPSTRIQQPNQSYEGMLGHLIESVNCTDGKVLNITFDRHRKPVITIKFECCRCKGNRSTTRCNQGRRFCAAYCIFCCQHQSDEEEEDRKRGQ